MGKSVYSIDKPRIGVTKAYDIHHTLHIDDILLGIAA